jgi:hypothetical protein
MYFRRLIKEKISSQKIELGFICDPYSIQFYVTVLVVFLVLLLSMLVGIKVQQS